MRKLRAIGLVVFLLFVASANAQTTVQKVSKQNTKKYASTIERFKLTGEKANIKISGWENDYIEITTTFISRNSDKTKAIQEINFIQSEEQLSEHSLIIRNYFDGNSRNITGNLSVEYQIYLPATIQVNLSNLYGKVKLENLNNPVQLSVSFGAIEIDHYNGQLEIKNNYSNLSGQFIDGILHCNSEKSDIVLQHLGAKTSIEAKYGNISLQPNKQLKSLQLNCSRSSVTIQQTKQTTNYQLKTINSSISLPERGTIGDNQYQSEPKANAPNYTVNTSYCPIIISYE
ncbi:MAG: hypothetical protein ACERKD_09500 [Prolixibacteraceae bacterium]